MPEVAEKKSEEAEVLEAKAVAKYVRSSSRKVKVILDLVRGKSVDEALGILQFSPKRAAKLVAKVINSAAANAERIHSFKRDDLYIYRAHVDQGPTLKRFRHRAMGRASRIRKRTSHITIVVRERKE